MRSTVTGESAKPCLAKSGNKHNRIFVVARPLEADLVERIESGDFLGVESGLDNDARSRTLVSEYGWSSAHARAGAGGRLWAWGETEGARANVLVDVTTGCEHLLHLRHAAIEAFQSLCAAGPLGQERVRGVRFDIVDARVHGNAAQRRGNELVPMSRRAMMGAFLTAAPALYEPLYRV